MMLSVCNLRISLNDDQYQPLKIFVLMNDYLLLTLRCEINIDEWTVIIDIRTMLIANQSNCSFTLPLCLLYYKLIQQIA